jgi:threonine dehydratase
MRHLYESHGLIVEGAGAVAVAALLVGLVPRRADAPVVAIVSGRNVDLSTWHQAVTGTCRAPDAADLAPSLAC